MAKANAKWWVLAVAMTMFVACSDDENGGSDGSSNSDTDAARDASTDVSDAGEEISLPDASREPDGPEILEFSVAPERLTEGGQMTITVAITDPQGFDDIGGGRILDESGGAYGLFTGTGGTYSAVLTWQQIHSVSPIDFEQAQQRVFIAEFFDSNNNRTTQPFGLELHCDGQSACGGTCAETRCTDVCSAASICESGSCVAVDQLDTEEHCGACGNACPQGNACMAGECICGGQMTQCGDACVDLSSNAEHCSQCDNACPEEQTCTDGTCMEAVASSYPCTDDTECGSGTCGTGDAQGFCWIPCQEDNSCPHGGFCAHDSAARNCWMPCSSADDCPDAMACENARQETGSTVFPDRKVCFGGL